MNLVRIIFELSTPMILNNELTVSTYPFAIDYPKDTDIVIDNMSERFIFNTRNVTDDNASKYWDIIQINKELIVLRSHKDTNKKINIENTSSHFIFPKRYIVELGNDEKVTYFTIYSKQTDKVAINLGTVAINPGVMLERNTIILRSDNISFTYDPVQNKVLEHKIFLHQSSPLPFRFLQHLKNKDLLEAQKLLAFKINLEKLESYFGNFEIILNNYLNQENLVTVKTNGEIKTLHFEIKDNLIQNIQ
ncbi:MAG: hypothetical protein FWE01_00345 [Firmicutes bacterium]|nr:hypothetical protein [Bacillota bacterium]